MKKHIFIIIIGILLIIGIALFSLRHVLIGHALKVSINKKTDETISLNIGEVYYDIINSTVSFSNSELLFNNTYLNNEKTIELSQLKFDEIKINKLSIFRLIFYREVIAHKFTIAKPSLWFMENHNPKPFKEKPKEIIKSLKKHHDILKNLTVIVDEIEITHGKVDLKSLIEGKQHTGSVEFILKLKQINTTKKSTTDNNKILFAEEHFVKLSNFNYTLPNGDLIDFDSVVFDSRSNTLITSNIKIDIKSGNKHSKLNPISAQIRNLIISGINFKSIEELHDIDIDNITISGVFLNLTNNDSIIPNSTIDTIKHKNKLFDEFHKINLSTLVLNNINLLNNNQKGDTIINLKNLNFSVKNIKIDSASLANKIPDVDYNSINISSGEIIVHEEKIGLNLILDKLLFSEKKGIISLTGLQIDEHKNRKTSSYSSDIASINISGISAQDFVNGKPLKVALDINNPIISFDLVKLAKNHSNIKKLNLNKIEISEVIISDGNIHILEENNLDVTIDGFSLNTGIIQLNDFSKIHEIVSDNLSINASSLKVNLLNKNIFVTTGLFSIHNQTFILKNIISSINNKNSINSSISVTQLSLNGFNINEIVNNKTININKFSIVKPVIEGSMVFAKKPKQSTSKHLPIDYKLSINDFEIIDGDANLNLNLNDNVLKIKTGIDVAIDNIYFADGNDTSWLNKLLWKIELSTPVIHYQDYLLSFKNIESDKSKNSLVLQDIEISDNLNSKQKSKIDIQKLSVKNVKISGLDYNKIIDKQRPTASKVLIQNPYFNIKIDDQFNKTNKAHHKLNKTAIPFDIENIEINQLSFNIEKEDSISISNLSLNNLDFKYNITSSSSIIDGLDYFDANGFLFSDTTKNSFVDIKNIKYSKQAREINISNIKGGNINKPLKNDNYINYFSSGLEVVGIDITQNFPYKLSIKDININDFDLTIENKSNKQKSKEIPHKSKIALPSILNSFSLDAISGNKINITHITHSDTSEKKLKLNNIGLFVSSIYIDSSTFAHNNFSFAEKISVSLKDNKFVSKDSLYATSINSIMYDFRISELTIDTFLMKPRYEPSEFFKKAIYQIGRMDIATNKIICSNIRFEKLIKHQDIHMGSVDVFGMEMYIYKNKKYEINPNTYKKMPQEALLSVSKTITIDSLKTHDSFIEYKQLSEKSVVPGVIFLNKINATIFNINNDLSVIDKTSSMVVYFNAKLLGESTIDLKVVFPILSPSYDFWVTGHVDKVNFTKLNSMTQNLVGVTLKKGTGEVDIPLITGNSKHSEGTIAFKYKKLKIELYDRDKAQNASGLGGSMANLLLNDILIKSNNPGFLGKTRTGEVYFKRDTQKSIVYYTWKSVLSGIMSTMGYNNKEQRQEKKALKRSNK